MSEEVALATADLTTIAEMQSQLGQAHADLLLAQADVETLVSTIRAFLSARPGSEELIARKVDLRKLARAHPGTALADEVAAARAREVELTAAQVDNAGLLDILRQLDYTSSPERAQRILNYVRDQEHPGRALMARGLAELSAAQSVIAHELPAARIANRVMRQALGAQGEEYYRITPSAGGVGIGNMTWYSVISRLEAQERKAIEAQVTMPAERDPAHIERLEEQIESADQIPEASMQSGEPPRWWNCGIQMRAIERAVNHQDRAGALSAARQLVALFEQA